MPIPTITPEQEAEFIRGCVLIADAEFEAGAAVIIPILEEYTFPQLTPAAITTYRALFPRNGSSFATWAMSSKSDAWLKEFHRKK